VTDLRMYVDIIREGRLCVDAGYVFKC
jgi:hypothetical protein